jgi:hypothetical protein
VGFYSVKSSNIVTLKLNSNHTFQYTNSNFKGSIVEKKDVDSCFFMTGGVWNLSDNKLLLNSYDSSFADTSRVRAVKKTSTTSKESSFSFIDIYGNAIPYGGVRILKHNSKETLVMTIVDSYFWNKEIAATKGDILIFYPSLYKPIKYIISDSTKSIYKIMLAPFYRQGYFKNKKFDVKRRRIVDAQLKFKKEPPSKNVPTI